MEYSCVVRTVPGAVVRRYVSGAVAESCRACSRYGRRWGCPPLGASDCEGAMCCGSAVIIGIDVAATADLRELRAVVEPVLLEYERITGGRMTAPAGDCPYCGPGESCARESGKRCRRPDCVRPSLEALGIDVAGLVREVFSRELSWGSDRLFIVAALFVPGDSFGAEDQLSSSLESATGRLASSSRSRES